MTIRACPIWRRRRFLFAAAKRFWSLGALVLILLWFSATATSDFEMWRYLALSVIALGNFAMHVHYDVRERLRAHRWQLLERKYKAALRPYEER